jgi:hypothetical protein
MRALGALVLAVACAAPCFPAATQDDARAPRPHDPPTTTGAAPGEPAPQMPDPPISAPVGHRQPRAADVPNRDAAVSPLDQEIDRRLQICRGC